MWYVHKSGAFVHSKLLTHIVMTVRETLGRRTSAPLEQTHGPAGASDAASKLFVLNTRCLI